MNFREKNSQIFYKIFFLFSKQDQDFANIPFLVLLITVSIFQLFKPCFIGQLIESGNEKLSQIIYEGDWISESAEHKKSLMILVESLKDPLKLHAINLFIFNMETFKTVSCKIFFGKIL